jgi:hypothetical protein
MASSKYRAGKSLSLIVTILSIGATASAAGFAGGTGQPNDPYQIATAGQLISLGSDPNLLDKHFVLVADINFADVPVIGPVVPSFKGWLDGRGHRLVNLHITAKEGGLFGDIELPAVVENLRLDGASLEAVTGARSVGTLAKTNRGLVRNCRVSGAVTGTELLGGLVGTNNGVLWACSADVQVAGSRYVGGLAGQNSGGLIACAYTHGSVQGTYYVGGLTGMGTNSGIVWRCYSTCKVATPAPTSGSNTTLGGLVGRNYDQQVYESYYLTPTDGSPAVNGPGTVLSEAQLRDSTSFVGWDFFGNAWDGTRDIWFTEQGGFPILSWETEQTSLGLVVAVRGQSLQDAAAHLAAAGRTLGEVRYDFDGVIPAGRVSSLQADSNSTVDLLMSIGAYSWSDNAGDGTPANPYRIATPGQLDCLGQNPSLWNRCFILAADIDLSGREYASPVLARDLDQATNEFQGIAFTGSFDGSDHTIYGLTIISARNYIGLFGCIGASADVSALNLEDTFVIGHADAYTHVNPGPSTTGALGGENAGAVADCRSSGIVFGTQETGGLVGDNKGSITRSSACGEIYGTSVGGLVGSNENRLDRCFVGGQVMGVSYTGGLVGTNAGTTADCFSMAAVPGSSGSVAGLVGYNLGTINRCYSIGRVQNLHGGLVGSNPVTGVVNQSFWDTEISGVPASDGGAGRTTDQMHRADTFAGWGDTWVIEDGIGYPQLAWTGAAGIPLRGPPARSYRGSGDPNDPFLLTTPQELVCLLARAEDWRGAVELACDIDMASVQAPSMVGMFAGILDGRGHCIRNLTLSGTSGSVGLIDRLQGGTIRNLHLLDVQIGGTGSYVGALGARASGATVSRCRVTGRITAGDGAQYVGGFFGSVSATTVTCCAAQVDIHAGSRCQYVGGLVGYSSDLTWFRDSYVRGAIAGMDQCQYFGGLAGATSSTGSERCYAVVRITMIGGVSGGFTGSYLGDCTYSGFFWDREVSPDSKGCGGCTTAAMQAPILYLDRQWDFAYEKDNGTADLWIIPAGGGYPELTCFVGIPEPPSIAGSGTPTDPYRIASVEDLLAIQQHDLSACYSLCADLDFSGRTLTSAPVPAFGGQFLGNGHTISNLYIVGDFSLGVFARILKNAAVSDLNVQNVNIAGAASGSYLGALAGRNHGEVVNCCATGFVTNGDDSSYTGGLVGFSDGWLRDCRAEVQIVAQNRCRYLGGLAGRNEGPVKACRAAADLQVGDSVSCVGGLIGTNVADLFLSESTGRISAGSDANCLGGLVGSMEVATVYHNVIYGAGISFDIIDCRADMRLAGLADCNNVGGLAGDFAGTMDRCYARGSITLGDNGSNVGGLVGRLRTDSVIPTGFWCVEGVLTHPDGGRGLTPAEMRDPNTFLQAGWDFVGEKANGTSDLWIMPQDADGPRLVIFVPGYQKPLLFGTGTADDPYLIASPQDLGAVNHYDPTANFRLIENLDVSAIEWSESPIWFLCGSLDGGGLQITGLRIRQAVTAGLIRRMEYGAVRALTIADADVTGGAILAYHNLGDVTDCRVSGQVSGSQYVGGLVAFNYWPRDILRCSSTATVTGSGFVGGLVGENSGDISQCFATGNVSGEGEVGGLVGCSYNDIADCYATGSVQALGCGGGLVGYSGWFYEYRCYVANSVSGTGDLGALVGRYGHIWDRDYSGNFWNTQLCGASCEKGTGLTTSQMKSAAPFKKANWDFKDVWMICEGRDYPRLKWESINCSGSSGGM